MYTDAAQAFDLPSLPSLFSFGDRGDQATEEPVEPGFGRLKNDILAYQFLYPIKSASGKDLPLTFSRVPEKYSSAAPLTADARQRIVAELVSLADAVTCAVFVGPVAGAPSH